MQHAREAHLEVVRGWVFLKNLLDIFLQAGRSAGSAVGLGEELVDRLCGFLGELVQILERGAVRGGLALGLFCASRHGCEHPAAVGVTIDLHDASLQAEVVGDQRRLVLQRIVVGSPLVRVLRLELASGSGAGAELEIATTDDDTQDMLPYNRNLLAPEYSYRKQPPLSLPLCGLLVVILLLGHSLEKPRTIRACWCRDSIRGSCTNTRPERTACKPSCVIEELLEDLGKGLDLLLREVLAELVALAELLVELVLGLLQDQGLLILAQGILPCVEVILEASHGSSALARRSRWRSARQEGGPSLLQLGRAQSCPYFPELPIGNPQIGFTGVTKRRLCLATPRLCWEPKSEIRSHDEAASSTVGNSRDCVIPGPCN